MRSEIRNIRRVIKEGAFGDPTKTGYWIYGRRPDGKTVACRKKVHKNGVVAIFSTWRSPSCRRDEFEECASEFTAAEWDKIMGEDDFQARRVCNRILDARKKAK